MARYPNTAPPILVPVIKLNAQAHHIGSSLEDTAQGHGQSLVQRYNGVLCLTKLNVRRDGPAAYAASVHQHDAVKPVPPQIIGFKRGIGDCVVFDNCLEGTAGTAMIEFYGFYLRRIERNRPFLFCVLNQILLLDEQEFRLRVDKSLDQPRTSDTVNFDVFPGNPLHSHLTVAKSMCT